jgi:phosphotransferase system HPr (HPr) family protein
MSEIEAPFRPLRRFSSDIWIRKHGAEVDGKSVLGLMVLGAKRGSKLRIRVEGPDAPEALRQIERLISSFEEGGDTIEAQDILDRPKLDAVDKLRTRSRRGQDSSKQGAVSDRLRD